MLNLFSRKETAEASVAMGRIENDGHCVPARSDLTELAIKGWEIKQQIEALERDLKTVTKQLENSLGAGAVLIVDGLCRVTLSARQTVTLTDPERCRNILGGRFDDLVIETASYALSDKLKDIARDPDHPLSGPLRECLAIRDSVTVAWRPVAKT